MQSMQRAKLWSCTSCPPRSSRRCLAAVTRSRAPGAQRRCSTRNSQLSNWSTQPHPERYGDAIMSTERELTIDKLDAVSSGALGCIEARFPRDAGGGGGNAGPAIAAWNTLLHQYGAA